MCADSSRKIFPVGARSKNMTREELLDRARKRDFEWMQGALKAERLGDSELCWLYMAWRAENRRFIEKLEATSDPLSRADANNRGGRNNPRP